MVTEVENILSQCTGLKDVVYKPIKGELVCAMSQNYGSWYRGCIKAVKSPNEYEVYFIDYGNTEIVEGKNLQCIPPVLLKFPSLCVPVKFSNDRVAGNIELQKLYVVKAEARLTNLYQIIQLVETEETNEDESLVNVEEVQVSHNNNEKFTFDQCKIVPFDSGEQDIVIYSVDEYNNIFCAPFDEKNLAENIALPEILTEHCKQNGLTFDNCEPEEGEMVLAKYSEDNQWYRGTIIEKSPPLYDVNFVDFGNIEQLDILSLRKMEKQFMALDVQAHMCKLNGFSVAPENSEKVYEELKTFTIFSSGEPLRALVDVSDEIIVNVPRITSWLSEKGLVTVSPSNVA